MNGLKNFINSQAKNEKIKVGVGVKVKCKIMNNGKIEDSYCYGYVSSISDHETALCKMVDPFKEYYEAMYQFDTLELILS